MKPWQGFRKFFLSQKEDGTLERPVREAEEMRAGTESFSALPEKEENPTELAKSAPAMQESLKEQNYLMNRELSWLLFNERVLDEAGNPAVPLGERLSFLSIYQTNLDEFFMVRVGTLMEQMESGDKEKDNKTGMTAKQQVRKILKEVKKLEWKKQLIHEQLMGELEPEGIRIINFQRLSKKEQSQLEDYFRKAVLPFLSPVIVSKRSLPFLQNRECYALAVLKTGRGKRKLGIVPCSNPVFRRLIEVPGRKGTLMLSEELILDFVEKLYPNCEILEKAIVRVTRNADIDLEDVYDEDLDYRGVMERLLKWRSKLNPVRLELSRPLSKRTREKLAEYLYLPDSHIVDNETPLDFSFISQIQGCLRDRPRLFYQKLSPRIMPYFERSKNALDQLEKKDVLLSYPYESMRSFLRLLQDAAADPSVVSIRITLYRVADHSQIVEALCDAAEAGKEVLVLIELRARFDEANNIETSYRLEDSGCQIIYGLGEYKVHSKLCLITRKQGSRVSCITQVATGNYNEKTASLYTDLCLMTANETVGRDANEVFRALLMGETVKKTEALMVAPHCLQNKILELMDREILRARHGEDAYIGIKVNSLTDKTLIDRMAEASCAGVKIELLVRGICCLIPGIPGRTENIRVISVVGRFLEHSRIYIFGKGRTEEIFISSADFMTRNTLHRVEVAVPILSESEKQRVHHIFSMGMADTEKGRELLPDGKYHEREVLGPRFNSQEAFYREAYARQGGSL